ncbi:MAG TPA: FAD-dependent oxidoreductase [Candidatus Saccharimonadales bacterium]|nr:FAD-dependent oxidoreductase [Candidatus Saccharimonadales bacterium]
MKLTLIEKRPEAPDVITFVFKPEQPLSWQAGQYLHYTLPHDDADDRGVERWFTISAAPFEANPQITTRFSPKSSSFKRHLRALTVGAQIEADGPDGDFVIEDVTNSYVFIAGGIGITPFRSILKQADHKQVALDVTLLYGNRDLAGTVFWSELQTFANLNPKLIMNNILEPKRIDAQTIKALPDYQTKTYYVSGPEPMVAAMAAILDELGISAAQQKHDDFPGYDWPLA